MLRHLAFDLELEQSKSNPQTPDSLVDTEKIIQIGWIIYELGTDGPNILKEELVHIKNLIPISKYIKKLTGIKDYDILNGISLERACKMMQEDFKNLKVSNPVKQWGSGDLSALNKEFGFPVFKGTAFNVKHLFQAYAEVNGLNGKGGLESVVNKKLRLPGGFEGRAHNALVDAFNTAKVHNFLVNSMRGSK